MSTEGCRPLDLGIAFVNLPSSVYPCVAMLMGTEKENIQVTLDYVSGPKGIPGKVHYCKFARLEIIFILCLCIKYRSCRY